LNRPGQPHPAAATGITQTGTYLGAVSGPLLFGVLVEAASYDVAWVCTAVTSVAAAGAVLTGRRMLLAANARRLATAPT
jgi:cyanate permease